MIASTSSGASFGGLARYLAVGRSGREVDRVAWTAARNLPTDDPRVAARLMEATAELSVKVEKPVYHLSLSFDPTDTVDRQRMEDVADRLLRALDLREHQALLVAHRDRQHAHVHLMINRVHPESGVAWERWQDRPRIEKTLRQTERELGLREVPGRLYRAPGHELPERALETSRERRAAERSGELSFAQEVRQHVSEFRQARTWQELEQRLAEHRLRMEPKGQGLVITDGERHIQASHVARDLSMKRLEERFDRPIPGRAPPEPGRDVAPAIRDLVRDLRAYETVSQHREAVREAEARAREIEHHAHGLNRAAREWRAQSEVLDRELIRIYRAPGEARALLVDFAAKHGHDVTARALRDDPSAFGTLRMVERSHVLGLVRFQDAAPARTEAERLPDTLTRLHERRDAVQTFLSRSNAPLTDDRVAQAQHAAVVAVKSAETRVRELHEAGRSLSDHGALGRSIGESAMALSRPELRTLRSFVTDAQALVVGKLRDAVRELALDRHHGHDRGMGL